MIYNHIALHLFSSNKIECVYAVNYLLLFIPFSLQSSRKKLDISATPVKYMLRCGQVALCLTAQSNILANNVDALEQALYFLLCIGRETDRYFKVINNSKHDYRIQSKYMKLDSRFGMKTSC